MTIEIVDFPIKNGGSFQFAMLVYQRVSPYLLFISSFCWLMLQFVSPAASVPLTRWAQEPLDLGEHTGPFLFLFHVDMNPYVYVSNIYICVYTYIYIHIERELASIAPQLVILT